VSFSPPYVLHSGHDRRSEDVTGTYAIPFDRPGGERALQAGRVGRHATVTHSDRRGSGRHVEFDVATGIRVRTYGIEQFATA